MFEEMDFLSKTNIKYLKGMFAIFVLLHHCRAQMSILNETIVGMALTSMGYLSVGMFYFLSGYGLEKQILVSKEKYIEKFFSKKIVPFYFICVIMIFLYSGFKKMIGIGFSNQQFIKSFLFGDTVICNGWYLQSILIIYIFFYLIYKNFKKYNVFLIFVFLVIYSLFSYFFIKKNIYFESVFCFELGIFWAINSEKIEEIFTVEKYYYFSLIISFFLFSITLIFGNIYFFNETIMLIFKMLSSILFVIFFLILIKKINISNKLTLYLGDIFLEIYIFQGFVLEMLHSKIVYIKNDFTYLIFTVGITIFIARLANPILKKIQKKV